MSRLTFYVSCLMMSIATYIQEIGARDHKLAMRDLKPLSDLNDADHDAFWPAWRAIMPPRHDEIAVVRALAIEGLWEDTSSRVLRKLLTMLQSDPAPDVRADAARALSRF